MKVSDSWEDYIGVGEGVSSDEYDGIITKEEDWI